TPHDALAKLERDIAEILKPAVDAAEVALVAASDDELPRRLADRDRVRRALDEAQAKLPELRAAVARAAAAKEAEERRQAEAAAARLQVRAMTVHATVAAVDDASVLFAAARVLNAAAHARLGEHAASPIAAALVALDAATTPADKDRALALAAGGAAYPKNVT